MTGGSREITVWKLERNSLSRQDLNMLVADSCDVTDSEGESEKLKFVLARKSLGILL